MVIGILLVLAVAIFFAVKTCKNKDNDLYKWIGIFLFVAFCLTWIIPLGYFQDSTFVEYGMNRLGLSDIPSTVYYAISFCLSSVIYLLALGGLYGVLSKSKSYSALVKKTADLIKGKEIVTTIAVILTIVVLTAFFKTTFAVLFFIPFIVGVLANAKYDKVTTMGITFGSLLVGSLFAVYGTDGLASFNAYSSSEVSVGIWHRVIIGAIALALFVLYNVYRSVKQTSKTTKAMETEEVFELTATKVKQRIWPAITLFAVVLVFMILAFVDWKANFGIKVFDSFHEWLTKISIGKNFNIFSYILGTNPKALGMMDVSSLATITLIITVIVGLANRMKLKDFGAAFAEGVSKMIKPVGLYVLAYAIFSVSYLTPFMVYISDWALGLTKAFNPFITAITAFVTSVFHLDLGYTSYVMSGKLASYASDYTLVHTIYIVTHALAQLFVPISGMLLIGLSYLKLDYKQWFKYIWMFVVAMVIVLLIFVTIAAYAV